MGAFILIIFNAVFFGIGMASTDCVAVWISFAFVNMVCLFDIISSSLISTKEATWAAAAMPLKILSKMWILTMLIISTIIMVFKPSSWQTPLLILSLISIGFIGLWVIWYKKNCKIRNS